MPNRARRKRWLIAIACSIACLLLIIGVTLVALNPTLTRWVESPDFRAMLEMETAKGLHFPSSQFTPIRRTGHLSARADAFHAHEGWKAMTALDTNGIA